MRGDMRESEGESRFESQNDEDLKSGRGGKIRHTNVSRMKDQGSGGTEIHMPEHFRRKRVTRNVSRGGKAPAEPVHIVNDAQGGG